MNTIECNAEEGEVLLAVLNRLRRPKKPAVQAAREMTDLNGHRLSLHVCGRCGHEELYISVFNAGSGTKEAGR